jgi:hypothetical protein
MKKRIVIFLALCILHSLPFYLDIAAPLAPMLAGSVYVPLLGLEGIGVPVFSSAPSGGWQTPNPLGWGIVVLLWLSIWWCLAGVMAKVCRKPKHAI